MRKLTYREFLGWIHFLNEEWNNPNRTDHYLMMIAAEIEASRLNNVNLTGDLTRKKITFKQPLEKSSPEKPSSNQLSKEEMKRRKEAWRARRNKS